MEIVITIALLIVPIISVVALVLTLRTVSRVKALKQLVIDLSKIVSDYGKDENPVSRAMQDYRIGSI